VATERRTMAVAIVFWYFAPSIAATGSFSLVALWWSGVAVMMWRLVELRKQGSSCAS
jgi:hypothetical protein